MLVGKADVRLLNEMFVNNLQFQYHLIKPAFMFNEIYFVMAWR